MSKIIVTLKDSETVEVPNTDSNVTAVKIFSVMKFGGYIRLYNHIFNCNEIIHVEVTE